LAYRMIAEPENESVKVDRESRLLIVAKARIWASEGWSVVIIDTEDQTVDFEGLLAA
jgi:hypothetical protein